MSSNTDATDSTSVPADDEQIEVQAFDLRVGKGGRLTIPESKRKRYDIEAGDYVDATFVVDAPDDGDTK
jgi:hypothetical protein